MPTFSYICEACGGEFRQYRPDYPPRFCSRDCQRKGRYHGRNTKHVITPEAHEAIRELYLSLPDYKDQPRVRELAQRLGLPRWKVSRYATSQGWRATAKREPDWSRGELEILKEYAHRDIGTIWRHLRENGYTRSLPAIVLKRKRLNLISNLPGYSAQKLAQCLGVDVHFVLRHIKSGALRASIRPGTRTRIQGGPQWYILEPDIKNFLVRNIDQVDFRKIDKQWLVRVLTLETFHCLKLGETIIKRDCILHRAQARGSVREFKVKYAFCINCTRGREIKQDQEAVNA